MKVDVILGLQWGDEGKGKIVDVLAPDYDAVARFQGGPNAGHTLEIEDRKYVLRSIPSGILQEDTYNIIGSGVVIDPLLFKEEAEALMNDCTDMTNRLFISKKAHLILPTHRLLDAAYESAKKTGRIGTTGKGIGPAYGDKIGRCGLRVGDTLEPDFHERYEAAKLRHIEILKSLGQDCDIAELEKKWMEGIAYLQKFSLVDSEYVINDYLADCYSVLAEGAQGTMLDVDFGSYPFVTSSNTMCGGCCTGLGISPRSIGEVYGVFKAYCTRVGAGPFPTELHDETGETLCRLGNEYGSVTGRKRRCGWIDLVALRYAIMINGVTCLVMTKSDVLDTFDTIKVCVAYKRGDETFERLPYSIDESYEPVYTEIPGWKTDMSGMEKEDEFPEEFNAYLDFLENELETPIYIVSVGPNRAQTIRRYDEEEDECS
ncbi:MAG: adenylosuccinate synthase [Tannerellaceae bacterium]|nr:adenylosuccinate synthase [Tannerellaceae bacterium]